MLVAVQLTARAAPRWDGLLQQANITKTEALEHGDAIIDVLRFQQEQGCEPSLPTAQQASMEAKMAVQFLNENPADHYKMPPKSIGQGGMGTIYKGTKGDKVSLPLQKLRPSENGSQDYAIKKLALSKQTDLPALQNEIAMMKTSAHPNVVEYFESYMFDRCLWVVMELMDGGSLTNLIQIYQKKRKEFTEEEMAGFMKASIDAIAFLHSQGRIHRDIKSDNRFFCSPLTSLSALARSGPHQLPGRSQDCRLRLLRAADTREGHAAVNGWNSLLDGSGTGPPQLPPTSRADVT
eukprot:766216-Hanusia_phi.AAC.4